MLPPVEREFRFTRRDFERIREMIYRRAGISLAVNKRDMAYGRLVRRVRALQMPSFADYLDFLEQGDSPEWEAFTNALTTNLTSFFRESHHFDVLKKHLAAIPRGRKILLWSSAASTGEEPYSIAIAAAEHFNTMRPPVHILATDLDTQVLEVGAAGIYPMERVARMDSNRLRRFFRKGRGEQEGYCKVADELRETIEFRQLNLLEPGWDDIGPFDAIFCRNVMIYFDKPTQRRVLERFLPLLRPDGLLFAGHSESFFHAADLFTSCGRTVYRRTDAPQGKG